MATTLLDIKNLINDNRRDTTTGSVDMSTQGLRAINMVLQDMQDRHDWEFTVKQTEINYFQDIDDYPMPSDYKAVIDVAPVNEHVKYLRRVSPEKFALIRGLENRTSIYAESFMNAACSLKLYMFGSESTKTLLSAMDQTDGTWTADTVNSDALNVTVDTLVYVADDASSSINFDSGSMSIRVRLFTCSYACSLPP